MQKLAKNAKIKNAHKTLKKKLKMEISTELAAGGADAEADVQLAAGSH